MVERMRLKRDAYFVKGQGGPGRRPGVQNKMTTQLKTAIITACEMVGRDKHGKDGVEGYLARLAINHPAVMGRLLEKLLPLQLMGAIEHTAPRTYETLEDLSDELKARGLPLKLIDVTPTRQ